MKIARIDSHSIKVPFTFGGEPTGYGGRNWTTNNILLVRVETDTGLVGWGRHSATAVRMPFARRSIT